MEVSAKRTKLVLLTTTLLSVVLAILMGVTVVSMRAKNNNLKADLREEKLKQDSILSTKILLDKEIADLLQDIDGLRGNNAKLDSLLNAAKRDLNSKMSQIAGLTRDNQTAKNLRKELNDIKQLRDKLSRQVDDLLTENALLKNEIGGLKDELATLRSMPKEVLTPLTANNFRIELLKRNERLTIKHRRTKAFQLAFELTGLEQTTGEQEFYVSIADPSGAEVLPASDISIKGNSVNYSVKLKLTIAGKDKAVNTKLSLGDKLKLKGIYKVKVYHVKYGLIGGAEVRVV